MGVEGLGGGGCSSGLVEVGVGGVVAEGEGMGLLAALGGEGEEDGGVDAAGEEEEGVGVDGELGVDGLVEEGAELAGGLWEVVEVVAVAEWGPPGVGGGGGVAEVADDGFGGADALDVGEDGLWLGDGADGEVVPDGLARGDAADDALGEEVVDAAGEMDGGGLGVEVVVEWDGAEAVADEEESRGVEVEDGEGERAVEVLGEVVAPAEEGGVDDGLGVVGAGVELLCQGVLVGDGSGDDGGRRAVDACSGGGVQVDGWAPWWLWWGASPCWWIGLAQAVCAPS